MPSWKASCTEAASKSTLTLYVFESMDGVYSFIRRATRHSEKQLRQQKLR